ncbi:patatin-like phospholipase domain protein [Burkholderia pseudomallei MSHR640]|nr:patatin-like phospholipase domain protein [Burkholderia pseudomallei MSHR640]
MNHYTLALSHSRTLALSHSRTLALSRSRTCMPHAREPPAPRHTLIFAAARPRRPSSVRPTIAHRRRAFVRRRPVAL